MDQPIKSFSPDIKRAIELIDKLTSERSYVPSEEVQKIKVMLEQHSCQSFNDEPPQVDGTEEKPNEETPDQQASKATVTAFAESEGHAHSRTVELPKTWEGLGLNIIGGSEQNSPIYISRIIPGGVAYRLGGLKKGDQLLAVNGVDVEEAHHEKAVDLLKAAEGKVKLVVKYTPQAFEEVESRIDRRTR